MTGTAESTLSSDIRMKPDKPTHTCTVTHKDPPCCNNEHSLRLKPGHPLLTYVNRHQSQNASKQALPVAPTNATSQHALACPACFSYMPCCPPSLDDNAPALCLRLAALRHTSPPTNTLKELWSQPMHKTVEADTHRQRAGLVHQQAHQATPLASCITNASSSSSRRWQLTKSDVQSWAASGQQCLQPVTLAWGVMVQHSAHKKASSNDTRCCWSPGAACAHMIVPWLASSRLKVDRRYQPSPQPLASSSKHNSATYLQHIQPAYPRSLSPKKTL